MFTSRRLIISVFLLLTIFLTGCMGANETFIQGEWYFEEPHLKNLPAEPPLAVTWNFNGGGFYHYACCFNTDLEIWGKYRVLKEEGNVLTLELYDVESNSPGRYGGELRIEINEIDDTLTIVNAGPFTRLTTKYSSDE